MDCFSSYIELSGDNRNKHILERSIDYYLDNFFIDNKKPKYYHNHLYPIDSTAVAQSIITLVKISQLNLAKNVANWIINNFQSRDGHFYFRKHRFICNTIPYMRWSDAWMFVALSYLLYCIKEHDLD